ncbi:hypothetical protein [Qipengyuania marisflavi]|uniref:Uncharacterized protein n=1 Tax=Qipengyuania marisflavi TaxID=2486356 RepID=A0A5S3P155_9SPHN|nr:hypothetical protein [Qipengyuania marisflavi]TMM46603.1 hypothetical protein FEV51_11215 [Qipengyuania marisflavi]
MVGERSVVMSQWAKLVMPCLAAFGLVSCEASMEGAESEDLPSDAAPHDVPAVRAITSPERALFEMREASSGDYIINFGEPFVGFESRGDLIQLRDFTSGEQVVSWHRADRTDQPDRTSLKASAHSADGDAWAYEIVIERAECLDEFSGETTDFVAWLNSGQPGSVRGCARPAGAPQRWPEVLDG